MCPPGWTDPTCHTSTFFQCLPFSWWIVFHIHLVGSFGWFIHWLGEEVAPFISRNPF